MQHILSRLAVATAVIVTSAIAMPSALADTIPVHTIQIDPGPIGTTFAERDFSFSDLNGIAGEGQLLRLQFIFPQGIDAVYRYDDSGTRNLYGWHTGLSFESGGTVDVTPYVANVHPIDAAGDPVGPGVGVITFYNATTTNYNMNYNTTYFEANLIAFTDVPYHGVTIDVRLPGYLEPDIKVIGGTFGFRRNGSGEFTEIVAGSNVPEPSSLALLLMGGIGLGCYIRRNKRQTVA